MMKKKFLKLVTLTLLVVGLLTMVLDQVHVLRVPVFPKNVLPSTLNNNSRWLSLNESIFFAKDEENKLHSSVQHLPTTDLTNNVGTTDSIYDSEFPESQLNSEEGAEGRGGEAGKGVDDMPHPIRHILILSSVGRSGSTFMGELLSQEPNTAHFFEPVIYVQKYKKKEVTQENSLPVVLDMFNCEFRDDFIAWLRVRGLRSCYRNNVTKHCKKRACPLSDLLKQDCEKKTLRVIKVIRMRLHWVEPLLRNPKLNLKVIHLVRDPRASLTSMARLRMSGKEPEISCPRIMMDLQAAPVLQEQFPGKVFSVKYENFFRDPEGTATGLWRFLRGADSGTHLNLPLSWRTFLKDHTTAKVVRSFNTFRDSKQEVTAWRQEIKEGFLLKVEKHCAKVIVALGHTIFGSRANALNETIPLLRSSPSTP